MIKSRILRWTSHEVRIEEDRSSFKMLTGKPTGKRSLGRPRRRCEYNIRIIIRLSRAEHVVRIEEGKSALKMLTGKHIRRRW